MKISINTIRMLNATYQSAGNIAPEGATKLAEKIGAQLGAIEEAVDIGKKYQDVVIAKVVSCEKHPNADKLHICWIDDGDRVEDVERNEQGLVQVVCGAPNVRAGLTVAWLPPGATVPESVGDGKEPFVLGSRELRGVVSNGMLASPRELALGDSHEGILEIGEGDGEIAPGTSFAERFNLIDDVTLDIENKMFTHRPDCFGLLGVSRELAGIQHMPFTSPKWYRTDVELPAVETDVLRFDVRNELPELTPRFTAITMRDVEVGPSPVWLQVELAKVGSRSINNIVDLTNYFMILTGQPLHAYDYDKVAAQDNSDHATLVVRQPREGEKIKLLNGKEIEPRAEAIMIATENSLIGIGGVMGGADTEVGADTKNIIIECANFDMYSIRRTSMAHGLFTDAVTRFNKGQSPLQTRAVLAEIVEYVRNVAGGKVASQLIDDLHVPAEVMERNSVHAPVSLAVEFINTRLGFQLSADEITTLLTNVEFQVAADGDNLTVTAPFWRTDIEIPEDVVEEVGRLYGFDHLPLELPKRALQPAVKNDALNLKQQIRESLRNAGANEVLTYSFVHGKLLERTGQDPEQAFKLSNALSPDLQYYRLSLTPSLLDKVHPNIKAGYDEFTLFEIGKAHKIGVQDATDTDLPGEEPLLAVVVAANPKAAKQHAGAALYQARKYLDVLLQNLGADRQVTFEPYAVDGKDGQQVSAPFEPSRTATLRIDGKLVGYIGEYRQAVASSLKLPEFCAGFELNLQLLGQATRPTRYTPLSRYPKIDQDVTLKVPADTTFGQLYDFVNAQIGAHAPENTIHDLTPIDIYQREDDKDHKQITLRLTIASYDKTLRDSEVTALLDEVAAAAHQELHAVKI